MEQMKDSEMITDEAELEKAAESGIMMELCPELVCGAVEIMNRLLEDVLNCPEHNTKEYLLSLL